VDRCLGTACRTEGRKRTYGRGRVAITRNASAMRYGKGEESSKRVIAEEG